MHSPNSDGFILVVDDDENLNEALCDILLSFDYKVKSATNGQEALDLLAQSRPDLILSDISMPVMDGHTLLKHTRSNPDFRSVPFIFLTSHSDVENQRMAVSTGIEAYLTKPVETDDLILAIENVFRRNQVFEEETSQRMDALRHEIIGVLQHEFRTPLTYVLTYSQYIQDLVAGDEVEDIDQLRTATAGVLEGGERLQNLIESFLLLADLQNRTISEDEVDCLPAQLLLQEAADQLQLQIAQAQLQVSFEQSNAQEAVVACEVNLVGEVLKRLIDNAIRYRRPESRHIWLSVWQNDEKYIGLRIRDEGVGIAADVVTTLSQPFAQGDRTGRLEPGAGMSLAMIRHIAQLHDGFIDIDSSEGTGTAVTLWLPMPSTTIQTQVNL